jgi:hypothetical protein
MKDRAKGKRLEQLQEEAKTWEAKGSKELWLSRTQA